MYMPGLLKKQEPSKMDTREDSLPFLMSAKIKLHFKQKNWNLYVPVPCSAR